MPIGLSKLDAVFRIPGNILNSAAVNRPPGKEMPPFKNFQLFAQMHQLFGSLYVNTVDDLYRRMNLRAYQDYRSSGLFMSARSAVLFALAEMGASDREWLMKNPHGCFIVQMLMNNLPADQRTKLAHILLDVEDPDAAQKLIRELIVDVNGSRSLEGLVRSASDEVVNSLFISWELGEEKRDSFMRTEQSF